MRDLVVHALTGSVPLKVSVRGDQASLTLGEGGDAEERSFAVDELTCVLGRPTVHWSVWVYGLVGAVCVMWFTVAEGVDGPSIVAGTLLTACAAGLLRAALRLRFPAVLATRSEFVSLHCSWRDLNRLQRVARRLQASRLSRAWQGGGLVDLPRLAWTEFRLALFATEALLEQQREREQSPMRRDQYGVWRQRHAQSVAFFGLLVPTAVALTCGLAAGSTDGLLGSACLWFALMPVGTALAMRVRTWLVKADGVEDTATLRPMFRRRAAMN